MNLLDLVKGELNNAVLGKLGSAVGLGSGEVSKAMDAIVPTQLSALIQKGSSPAGAKDLLGMLGQFAGQGSVASALDKPDGLGNLTKLGESLLPMLFGNKLSGVVGALASSTGLGNNAISGLMKMAGPVLMGVLANQTKGLNPMGLMNILSGMSGMVSGLLPKGVGDLLGGLGSMGQAAGNIAGQAASQVPARRAGFPIWIPIVALLVLLGLLLAFFNRQSSTTSTPTTTTAAPTGEFKITEPTEGASLPAGAFALKGTGKPGDEIEVLENGASLGKVTVGTDGTWSLNVPSGAAGARSYEVKSPAGSATLNVTAAQATGSAANCTKDFSLSITDGQTVSEPFRFGGVGKGKGYSVTIMRGDHKVGTKDIPLDSTCGWSYTSKPGKGSITYEVREIGAAADSAPASKITLTVK